MKTPILNQLPPAEALTAFKELIRVAQENNKVKETEMTKRQYIQAMKEIEIEKIRANKEVLKHYLQEIFAERKEVLKEFFKILDHGIESNDINIVSNSLSAIVAYSKISPLAEIEKLQNDFHNPDIKEITI